MGTGLSGNGSATAHRVQFYESDDEIIERLTRYVQDGLRAGAAVVVADAGHCRKLEKALSARGVDAAREQASGRLTILDAEATLRRFYDGDRLDPEAFDRVVGGVLERAGSAGGDVHVYGEMVAILWDAGEINATLELEELWNELGRRRNFELLCGYPAKADSAGRDAVDKICASHNDVAGPRPAADEVSVSCHFEPELTAAADVRRFVDSTLVDWGAEDLIDDVRLVASELVTNAVRHVGSELTVTLSRRAGRLRVAVADRGTGCPGVVSATATAPSGRGLKLVQAVAADWGCDRRPGGKVVWADV